MVYRLVVNMNFDYEHDADNIIDKALDSLEQAIIINPGQNNEERGYIELQQCFHDEDPTTPCVVLKHIEP